MGRKEKKKEERTFGYTLARIRNTTCRYRKEMIHSPEYDLHLDLHSISTKLSRVNFYHALSEIRTIDYPLPFLASSPSETIIHPCS